jgi:hypothetical protein
MSTVTSDGIGKEGEHQTALGADDEEAGPVPITLHFPENGEPPLSTADVTNPFGAF